jgi:N-acyl-L-homoserine lactone synthetase
VSYNFRVNSSPSPLDVLAREIMARQGLRFAVTTDDAGREAAFRLRYRATVEEGWQPEVAVSDGLERDAYDDLAVHIVGWDGETPIATGRLVLPPGPLPTEDICAITVEPRGRVVDVGRMSVARGYRSHRHRVFVALLARLYLEVRSRGYDVACGLMSARARALVRFLGLHVEALGEDRLYWGEARAPVRFTVADNATPLATRWRA